MKRQSQRHFEHDSNPRPYKRSAWIWVALCLVITSSTAFAADQSAPVATTAGGNFLFVKAEIDGKIKFTSLKPGDVLTGAITRDVYSGDRQVLPAGSRITVRIDHLEKRRREANDHWPWVIQAFTPRHEAYPVFHAAVVTEAGGTEVPLRVSSFTLQREVEIYPQVKRTKSTPKDTAQGGDLEPRGKTPPRQTLTLEAEEANPAPCEGHSAPATVTLDSGTRAKVILMGQVSASRSRIGDTVQARLVEPVSVGSTMVLPEGTLLEGKVVRSRAPRMLSRAGSLDLTFTALTLPDGSSSRIAASVAGLEVETRSHLKIDPEGQIHGDRPGKAWMLINLGVTSGIAKEVDDGTQLVIEAIVSTATDASTAGTARFAAMAASGLFMLTRHGRDVILPKFTEMSITLDRPVSLPGPTLPPAAK